MPTRRGHLPPGREAGQPLAPKGRVPRSQGGGGQNFVTVNNRLYAPLEGLNPNNVLMGGYGWLSITDQGATYHPGLDLNSGSSCNSDEGAQVVSPLAGIVRSVLYAPSGEGNHIWVELDDPCLPGPTFWHTDHLLRVDVSVGQRLTPGQPIGTCGRTGGWDCAHAHTELLKGAPSTGYWQWPYGWPRSRVEAEYWNPTEWWSAATALVLAEGNTPITPEVVAVLNDWQIKHWIMPDLWQWAGIDFNPDAGSSQGWVDALRAGSYLGRPRTGERPYGEGEDVGVWMEFESGLLLYRLRDGQSSWKG